MYKRLFFVAALVCSSISTGSVARAAEEPLKSSFLKVFDLSALDEVHRELVIDALDEFDYDWTQLKPALNRNPRRTHIKIRIVDIAPRWNAVGLSWPNGVMDIDDQVTDDAWFQDVVIHELGHMVDYFHLRPAKLRGKVADLYGAPWTEIWHDFNDGFIQAFSTYGSEHHLFDDELSADDESALRSLLGGEGAVPVKTI